jgi:DNA polymerase III subunit epsilon
VRQIIFDTETTGLEPTQGHRVVELGGVEILNRRFTGNRFHRYLNPERDIDPAAEQVHGLSRDFLQDKPKFEDIAADFIEYVRGAELIIHNAAFDEAFLDSELARVGRGRLREHCADVLDTLAMARELHPGRRNSLDALCERYQVDNTKRTLHGALLDAELLGEVYLAMTRGQESLIIDLAPSGNQIRARSTPLSMEGLAVLRASEAELAQHAALLARIEKDSKGACLWSRSL